MLRNKKKTIGQLEFDEALAEDFADMFDDMYAWVMYSFPWGQPGTDLADFDGPDEWQRGQMEDIKKHLQENPTVAIRDATSSGHGIGKTTQVVWLILWLMSTRPHLNGVVTANTTKQLSTKTWRELALWHKRMINKHWFEWTATRFCHVQHPETWFCNAIPNSEHNSEAFAGLHGRYVVMIFDEASGIPDIIFEVSEGAMTTDGAMWFIYGNPTRNTGRFRACFTEDQRWHTRKIDSRTAKMTNKEEIAHMVKTYGEDSDFVRVRVRGEFPRAGSMQFMPSDLVDDAMGRTVLEESYMFAPILLAADIARFGDDKTVIAVRQGRKCHAIYKFRNLNTMQAATKIAEKIQEWKPAASFVDGSGVGAGVVDRLRQLSYEIVEVQPGEKADDPDIYYNKRAEMWSRLRSWMNLPVDIPEDPETRKALISIEYGFDDRERIRMERKEDMKRRGADSPDEGDALAYTFAEIVGDVFVRQYEPEDSIEPEIVG